METFKGAFQTYKIICEFCVYALTFGERFIVILHISKEYHDLQEDKPLRKKKSMGESFGEVHFVL